MTTLDVGRLLKKSAAASNRPGLEREQSSIKVVTVKFGGPRGSGWAHNQDFLCGLGFPVLSRRIARRVFCLI